MQQDINEIDASIKLVGCTAALKPNIIATIKYYWGVFCMDGLRQPIRGYTFQVDTGASMPSCCKPPQYRPQETKVMNKLIGKLADNDGIDDDNGPWGALVLLSAKPHQDAVPW